jgi:dTDP-4-amino-4,6-dideoxygalactose transaminase
MKKKKDDLFKYLNLNNIYPQYHYIPIYKFSFYKKKNESYENAENYYKNTISLPIYVGLKNIEQIYIIKKLLQFANAGKS